MAENQKEKVSSNFNVLDRSTNNFKSSKDVKLDVINNFNRK
jgi:hypothetical protein